MIITCKKEIPKRWVVFSILPWASFTFNGAVVGTAFLFSLQKFVENPAGLTFILSLPVMLTILVSPIASFLSDRIWTRFGRRKPFIVASWTGMLVAMVLMPLMPNLWFLLAAYLLWHFSSALGAPIEPLKQEIIPPHERGWATGAMTWCSNLATMAFYFVMLGRFDDVSYLDGLPIHGECAIYWSASLFLAILLFLIILGIRETDQQSSIRGQRLTVRNFLGGLLDRELWPIYLLVFGNACLNFYAGLGALSNLLYTVQWSYTKQEMGVNVAVGGVVNLFIIGLLTFFADRLNRMRAYQTTLILSLLANIAYYCYVEYLLPDKRPTLIEIIVFGESISILSILVGLLYLPLVYDYVRRNLMGTFSAGATIVNRLTTLVTLNGVGLFVTCYASIFQPPAGEMTRVALRDSTDRTQLLSTLRAANWPAAPGTAAPAPSSLAADNWAATGVIEKQGRTWEIRHADPASEALAKEKEQLQAENSPLLTRQALAHDAAEALRREGRPDEASQKEKTARDFQVRIGAISKRIAEIDAELAARATGFRKQVEAVLGPRLITEGDQILGASQQPALLVQFAVTSRLDTAAIEGLLADLRREDSSIIDLRPLKRDSGYGLVLGALLPPRATQAAFAAQLQAELARVSAGRWPGILPSSPFLGSDVRSALTLNLLVVEQPIDPYVSPVTRAVNGLLALFGHAPDPRHRLSALARGMRTAGAAVQVRVTAGPSPRAISVCAVLNPSAAAQYSPDDPVTRRLAALLGAGSASLAQVRAFYDQVQTAAAGQHLTVAHPILAADYAPMRYDYMSGYLWMFVMAGIGIALTFYFERLEARGVISKRGVEEAHAS
jgi:Na+/melibiose symporter-like transporter